MKRAFVTGILFLITAFQLRGEKVYDVESPIAICDTDPDIEKIDHVFVWPKTAEAGVLKERFATAGYENVRPSDHDPTLAAIDFPPRSNVVLDNTIFIFISDNDPHYGGSTGGLKGKKATSWKGGVRVSFVARYPAEFGSGQVVLSPLWSLDIFPTLLELAGIPLLDDVIIDGESITAILKGGSMEHGSVFSAHNEQLITIRDGDWKLFAQKPRYLSKRDLNPDYVDLVWSNGVTILGQKEQSGSMEYPGVIPKPFSNPHPLFNRVDDPS